MEALKALTPTHQPKKTQERQLAQQPSVTATHDSTLQDNGGYRFFRPPLYAQNTPSHVARV